MPFLGPGRSSGSGSSYLPGPSRGFFFLIPSGHAVRLSSPLQRRDRSRLGCFKQTKVLTGFPFKPFLAAPEQNIFSTYVIYFERGFCQRDRFSTLKFFNSPSVPNPGENCFMGPVPWVWRSISFSVPRCADLQCPSRAFWCVPVGRSDRSRLCLWAKPGEVVRVQQSPLFWRPPIMKGRYIT